MPPSKPAVWLNKRAVATLELPLPHTFSANSQGWEVAFASTGTMVARFVHGGEQRFDIVSGDRVIGSGGEIYFSPKA